MEMTRERKIILAAALVLLPLAVLYRFGPSLGEFGSLEAEILAKRKQVLKYRIAIEEGQSLPAEIEALNRTLIQAEAGLLAGNTVALASVDIQNVVNRIAEEVGVELTMTRPLPPENREGETFLVDIPLVIRFDAGIQQLRSFLYRLESSPKFFQIDPFRVRVRNPRQPDRFQVEMTVTGYMRRSGLA